MGKIMSKFRRRKDFDSKIKDPWFLDAPMRMMMESSGKKGYDFVGVEGADNTERSDERNETTQEIKGNQKELGEGKKRVLSADESRLTGKQRVTTPSITRAPPPPPPPPLPSAKRESQSFIRKDLPPPPRMFSTSSGKSGNAWLKSTPPRLPSVQGESVGVLRMCSLSSGKSGYNYYETDSESYSDCDSPSKMFSTASGKRGYRFYDRFSSEDDKPSRKRSRRISSERRDKREDRVYNQSSSDEERRPRRQSRRRSSERRGKQDDCTSRRRSRSRMSSERSGKRDYSFYNSSSLDEERRLNRRRTRMATRSSGKHGYKPYRESNSTTVCESIIGGTAAANDDSFTQDRDLVMTMLKKENELRFSKETQEKYDVRSETGEVTVPPSTIEDNIQIQVLSEHGIEPSVANIHHYRCLNYLYRHDEQVSVLNGGLRDVFLKYRGMAEFLMVYVLEAHAKDEWPLGLERSCIPQHQTIGERIQAARKLMSEEKHGTFSDDLNCEDRIPVVVDTMENCFNNLFAAWPERLFIIKDKKLDLISYPPDGFLHLTAQNYLKNLD